MLGAWEDERLVGGPLASTPESPDWTDAQEALTNEFGREIGKKADQVVLNQDIFEIDAYSIHKTKVLTTVMDGEIVFERE